MKTKNTMYEEIFCGLYQSIDWMVASYNNKDYERNHVNYGSATAYAKILISMGHKVSLKVYGKEGYLLTDSIEVDGTTYDFFHK